MLDVHGGRAKTQILLWVTGEENAAWPSLLNDQVTLTADQEEYLPGQTANIFIPNPFGERVQALVTVERGKVLSAEVLTLGASGSTYSLNLTDEHAPNVYIAATLLGPDNQFRQGYVTVEVEPQAQELQVELTAQPEINEPRGEMTLQLRVTDSTGEPINGEFSLSVVDKAVLALADPNSPDILPAFYGKQSLGVSTGLSLADLQWTLCAPARRSRRWRRRRADLCPRRIPGYRLLESILYYRLQRHGAGDRDPARQPDHLVHRNARADHRHARRPGRNRSGDHQAAARPPGHAALPGDR